MIQFLLVVVLILLWHVVRDIIEWRCDLRDRRKRRHK